MATGLFVTSSIEACANHLYLVPGTFRGCGILRDLAEQYEAGTPVSIPFPAEAIQAWADHDWEQKAGTDRAALAHTSASSWIAVLEVCRAQRHS